MDNQKLGIFITELRKEKGLTQAQLAQKLNVTDKAVSKWERGVGFPDIKLLEPLADVLDISLLELMKSERLPKTTVSAPDTTDAFQNVIDLASYERKPKDCIMSTRNISAINRTIKSVTRAMRCRSIFLS